MAKKKVSSLPRSRVADREPALGPGIHGASIELALAGSYRIRTTSGARCAAVLGDGVDPALADDCLRTGRLVIVADGPRGPAIMGALQTSLPIARDADGVVSVNAKELRVRLDRAASIEVGAASITADAAGVVRIEGDRMVLDMGALVRVLSARVELP
ncbi:hypothetical protein [Sorangium sp. So ce1335]|uniref:hypothetical protein n=1 Tax=Sorangium sp. So ce1335 TaxID=3133335 RepID=UPI003F639EDE